MRESGQGGPLVVGIGLRDPHMDEILATRPAVDFLEVHAENYVGGGPPLDRLLQARINHELSVHGVGLSLGSAEGIDRKHLARLKVLVDRTQPILVSEHLSWSVADGTYLNDLLPLPYTEESLDVVSRNVAAMQDELGRRVLIENPSRYLRFRHSTIAEPDFLAAVAQRTGCGLLCDVNNIHVSGVNLGEDPIGYLRTLPRDAVGEIHLAGHFRDVRGGRVLLIDDHGAPVGHEVWTLYRRALALFGSVPTLIEWDRQIPPLAVLLDEAGRASRVAHELECADAFAS